MDKGASEEPVLRRFTADEAMRMVELGILREDEHLELLDGVLVEMSPEGPEHADVLGGLADLLRAAYPGARRIREEKPLAIDAYSLPEPDFAVIRGAPGTFANRHPTGPEAILVVEVARSSQRHDRRKAALYAAGGIEVYWILDLVARKLEVRTTPVDGAYQVTRVLGEDEVVELPESEARWTVRDLLP
jgi:Uma2 family endonuclease